MGFLLKQCLLYMSDEPRVINFILFTDYYEGGGGWEREIFFIHRDLKIYPIVISIQTDR